MEAAGKYGLLPESKQTGKKDETTSDDILKLLDTLWTRAADIPCSPAFRIALHVVLILEGLGFRPGSLMNIRYKDISFLVVRDPETGQTTLGTTITIHHEKRERKDPRGKVYHCMNSVQFTIFPIPFQPIDLAHLIATQAIATDAFEPSFSSIDEIYSRPNLEHTDALELHWKKEMLNNRVFDIDYHAFWETWNRLWLVAGNRDHQRPYSLRVGAGGKLDGTIPLRTFRFRQANFIQSRPS